MLSTGTGNQENEIVTIFYREDTAPTKKVNLNPRHLPNAVIYHPKSALPGRDSEY